MDYNTLKEYLDRHDVTLVAVSKTKPPEEILTLYNKGQRIFGENRARELEQKYGTSGACLIITLITGAIAGIIWLVIILST